MNGWIKLYRKFLDHKLWIKKRRFSMAEAWIDLLLLASHADHEIIRDYGTMTILRGQVLTSQLALSRRWMWNRESTSKFLRLLNTSTQTSTQTSKKTSTGYTLITIINYEKYQGSVVDETGIQVGDETGIQASIRTTSERHPNDTIKKGKKEKNTTSDQNGFDSFWVLYPKKIGKYAALKAWKKIKPSPDTVVAILKAVGEQKTCEQWSKDNGQFIPYPATWLNQGRWEDEIGEKAEEYERL